MDKRIFGQALPGLPLSSYIVRGNTVYTSGCTALDYETGKAKCSGDVYGQTRICMECLKELLEEAGSGMNQIDFMMIFIRDAELFEGMNKAYCEYFTDHFPARTTVVSSMVSQDVLVELYAIAGLK